MELISEVLREVSTKVILYNSMADVLYIDQPLIRQIEQGNSLKKTYFNQGPIESPTSPGNSVCLTIKSNRESNVCLKKRSKC